ncbi:MAG: hypothetical protein ACJAQT_001446 [Akkermansiaceae bacterium]
MEAQVSSTTPLSLAIHTGQHLDRLLTKRLATREEGSLETRLKFQAEAGSTYQLAIASYDERAPALELSLTPVLAHPVNDDFENRTQLGNLNAIHIIEGTNAGATAEPGEPSHQNFAPTGSVWWSFTSEVNGPCEVSLLTPTEDSGARLSYYTGTSLADLTELKLQQTSYIIDGEIRSDIIWNLQAGLEYFIAFDQAGNIEPFYKDGIGRLKIRLDFSTPQNDDFDDAIDLTGQQNVTLSANIARATRELGERSHLGPTAYPDVLTNSAWWTWVSPDDDLYSLTTEVDGLAIVYEISQDGAMREVTRRSPKPATFQAKTGTRYYFTLLSKPPIQPSRFFTSFLFEKITTHDHRSLNNALHLGAAFPLRKVVKTPPDDLPRNSDTYRYWTWVAPESGTYQFFTTRSATGNPGTQIFRGLSDIPEDEIIPKVPENFLGDSVYALEKSQIITIRSTVPYFLSRELSTLKISRFEMAANDDFSHAQELQTHPQANPQFPTYGTTTEENEPATVENATVWWYWIVPESGHWRFTATERTNIELFRGDTLTNLVPATTSAGSNFELSSDQPGERIYVRATNPFLSASRISIAPSRHAVNDQRSSAIHLGEEMPISSRSSLFKASALPDEPGPQNLWWSWTPSTSDPVIISSIGRGEIKLWLGSQDSPLDELQLLRTSDYGRRAIINAFPQAGKNYLISISDSIETWDKHSDIELQLEHFSPVLGDHFAESINLGNTFAAHHQGSSIHSTRDPSDPSDFRGNSGSVWLNWACPLSGRYRVEVASFRGEPFESFHLYEELDAGDLQKIESGDEDDTPMFLEFSALAGKQYRIALECEGPTEAYQVAIFPLGGYEDQLRKNIRANSREISTLASPNREDSLLQDEVSNLTRYFYGLDFQRRLTTDLNSSNIPQFSIELDQLTLRYRLGPAASQATTRKTLHRGEASSDGINWTHINPTDLGSRKFLVQVPIDSQKKFLRVRVWETEE